MLERFRMENCNLIDTPMAKGEKLSNNLCPKTPKQKDEWKRFLMPMLWKSDVCYVVYKTRYLLCYWNGN